MNYLFSACLLGGGLITEKDCGLLEVLIYGGCSSWSSSRLIRLGHVIILGPMFSIPLIIHRTLSPSIHDFSADNLLHQESLII